MKILKENNKEKKGEKQNIKVIGFQNIYCIFFKCHHNYKKYLRWPFFFSFDVLCEPYPGTT